MGPSTADSSSLELLSPFVLRVGPQCVLLALARGLLVNFLSLLVSHSLSCYLTLVPSDSPQGIQTWSLPSAMLPAPLHSAPNCWWQMRVSGVLFLGVAFRYATCGFYLFFLPVRLPSKIQKLPPDPPVRGFPGVWKLPLLRLPSQDGSPSLALLSLFLSFIFCPTSFQKRWAAFLGT